MLPEGMAGSQGTAMPFLGCHEPQLRTTTKPCRAILFLPTVDGPIMKPDKHILGAVIILLVAGGLIGLTWLTTMRAIHAQRNGTLAQEAAVVSNQAFTFSEQIGRQILTVDQTLRILRHAWETDPQRFDLEAWLNQLPALRDLTRDLIITDAHGIVRQSSIVDAISQDLSGQDFFIAFSQRLLAPNDLFIGQASIGSILREWHMNAALALRAPDGAFAGTIDTDYRIGAVTDIFGQTDLGKDSFIALIGLHDGKLRAAVGPATVDPDASIADTPMFAAISHTSGGVWIGPSSTDAVTRIHAFRRISDRGLVVVVGADLEEALRPAAIFRRHAEIAASGISALLALLALLLINGRRLARRRTAQATEDQATLAAANAQIAVARAEVEARAEQVQTALGAVNDGVAILDAHLCLVEWNALFPAMFGVPADMLCVGLPIERVLRTQIAAAPEGAVGDPDAEVGARLAHLRTAAPDVVARQRANGRMIEERCKRQPNGGLVLLCTDVTERRQTEEALHEARTQAEAANAAKLRFVAIASHELRTPLNGLLNTLRLLDDTVLTPAQQSLLVMAHQSGDVLIGLTSDILDMSQIEAGKLSVRPGLFELRPMLEGCIELFSSQAAEKGISIRLEIADGTPGLLLTDAARLRQVQVNLLSNAVKYARSGVITVSAAPGARPEDSVRLTVRDGGPVIDEAARQHLFRPFSRLERAGEAAQAGSGLGLSICLELMTLLGGRIGYETWMDTGGHQGNLFWTTLPLSALPYRETAAVAAEAAGTAPASPFAARLPRTRILLVEDVAANQLVTATLLRRAGHDVTVASSGEDAMVAVHNAPFDIIFMDMLMPGMGGREATRQIRALPTPAASIPVVALTADVADTDADSLAAAGLNGLLGKPVSLEEMLDAVRRCVWSAQTQRPQPPVAIDTAVTPAALLSAARIQELRESLPPDQLAGLVEECLTDLEHRLPALRRALAAAVPGAVIAHAHTMTGVAAAYGLSALEAHLRTIMAAARDQALNRLDPRIIDQVQDALRRSGQQLRDIARSTDDLLAP